MNNECLCLYQKKNFEKLFHSKVKDFLFDLVHLEDDEQDQIDKPYIKLLYWKLISEMFAFEFTMKHRDQVMFFKNGC